MRVVKLSKRAANKLNKLLEFLETKWSPSVKQEFIDKLDKCLKLIQEKPEIFPESELKKDYSNV